MATAAERFGEWATTLACDDIPADVAEAARLHLLDTLGCGLAAHAVGIAGEGRTAMAELGGAPEATVIGLDERLPAPNAAFANAMLCHGLDFDDTHAGSICHVGVVVVPAALAVAEATGATGAELVTALVAGSEVVTRVGAAAVGGYMVRGFHPTSVSGVFGATAAAGRLQGLSETSLVSALGLAGSMAAGLFAYLGDGTATKPVHAGWAAQSGIRAAELADAGAEGPVAVFEDRFGFYAAYYDSDARELEQEVADLGSRWETTRIAFKPYPACHFVHSCLDAAAALLVEHPLAAGEIGRITVAVPDPGVPLVLEPAEAKRDPRTEYDAKFSLQFSIAALVVHGSVGVETYTEQAIRDPDVLALAARVEHVRRDFPTYPRSFPGWVRIESRDGRVLERELEHQRGGPDNPMDAAEVAAKFRRNARLALDADAVEALERAVLALDEQRDLARCFAPLRAMQRG